jgi:hypothetical protein
MNNLEKALKRLANALICSFETLAYLTRCALKPRKPFNLGSVT